MNRLRTHLPEICVSLTLLSCYAYFFPRWAEWNQNSRMDLTLAIVDQGRFAIDDYYENTGDYAVYGDHVYTDNNGRYILHNDANYQPNTDRAVNGVRWERIEAQR